MFGFGATKTEKKIVKLRVQNVALPVMSILDEGELISIFIERNENKVSSSSEKSVTFLRNGDYGATFDEELVVPVTMKRAYNGDYKEKICQISVRKRKKGSAGLGSSSDAFRIIAWVDIDIKKYVETNKDNYISCKLNWTEKGKDFLGKGALLNAVLGVEDNNGQIEDDDDTGSVTSRQSKSTVTVTTGSKAIKPTQKTTTTAVNDNKKIKNPFGDDDDDDDDNNDNNDDDNKNNSSSRHSDNKNNNRRIFSTLGKKEVKTKETEKKTKLKNNSIIKNKNMKNNNNNNNSDDDDDDNSSNNDDDEEEEKNDKQNIKNGTKNKNSNTLPSGTRNNKKNIHNNNDESDDENDENLSSDDDNNNNNKQFSSVHSTPTKKEKNEFDQIKPLVGFPISKVSAPVSVHSASGARSESPQSSSSGNNPLQFVSKGVSGVVGGVTGVVGSVGGAVVGGVGAVGGAVVGGVTNGMNTILNKTRGSDREFEPNLSDHQGSMNNDDNATTPKFLTEFKERTYNATAIDRIHKSNFSNLNYQEIKLLKFLEEAQLENISYRQKCIGFEMQTRKCEFFANEVARVQDLVNTELSSKEKIEQDIVTCQNDITTKIDENAYLVDELLGTKAKISHIEKEISDVKTNIESLKLLMKQQKIKRDLMEQKRLKEERDKNSWW